MKDKVPYPKTKKDALIIIAKEITEIRLIMKHYMETKGYW